MERIFTRSEDASANFEGRIEDLNRLEVQSDGAFVVYWMHAQRRLQFNHALERAVAWATQLQKPLVIIETLGLSRWPSERHYAFVLDGMAEHAQALEKSSVHYLPFIETRHGEVVERICRLGELAAVIVADDFPIRDMREPLFKVARQNTTKFEAVDSNGLLPLRQAPKVFLTAASFRRFMQKNLPRLLGRFPKPQPLAAPLPRLGRTRNALKSLDSLRELFPRMKQESARGRDAILASLSLDHRATKVDLKGGTARAIQLWRTFLEHKLEDYHRNRNHPDLDATSGLAPYLHHGYISTYQIFCELIEAFSAETPRTGSQLEFAFEDKSTKNKSTRVSGDRWLKLPEAASAFLDQVITWRELGFNCCHCRHDYDQYDSLPAWAKNTLETHKKDRRPWLYSPEEFEAARTHDPLWNAAQRQLVTEGKLHNYARMLWGKKILEWSSSPEEALQTMIDLNNRYGLDGNDPNSYTGIFWILGRYDRPWGPERPIFGTIRYMSSESARRKLKVKNYLARYSD